jgi:hypothetical protein
MVDATNHQNMLETTGLACENLVYIQGQYRVGSDMAKYSLVDLAVAIIDP